MKQFEDLLPLLVFGVAYWFSDLYLATGALMVAFALQVGWKKLRGQEVSRFLVLSLVAVLVLGGLTLLLRSSAFIQFKPTLVWWVMGGALAISQMIGHQNLLERMLGRHLELPAEGWCLLNLGWAALFLILGGVNLAIAAWFSEATWVAWKLASGFGLLPLLVLGTVLWLYRRGFLKMPEDVRASGSQP